MQNPAVLPTYLTVFLLTSCSHLTKSKIAAIENAVLDVHQKLTAAAESRNADAMFEYILDSDQTLIQTGDTVQTRRQALESVREGFQQFEKIQYEFTQRQITVLSPEEAEMTAVGRSINTTYNGRILTFPFTQTIGFVLTDDGWKIKYARHTPQNPI